MTAKLELPLVKKLIKAFLLISLGYVLAFGLQQLQLRNRPAVDLHYHADIAVFINGQKLDFSSSKYQSSAANRLHTYIHFHDGNGTLLHIHKSGLTLRDLFRSWGGDLTNNCLVLGKAHFCSNLFSGLKLYVNGRRIWLPTFYQPQDLDQILLSFGPWLGDTAGEIVQLTNQACIYSLKCPQRGEPPSENCLALPGDTCVLPGETAH